MKLFLNLNKYFGKNNNFITCYIVIGVLAIIAKNKLINAEENNVQAMKWSLERRETCDVITFRLYFTQAKRKLSYEN